MPPDDGATSPAATLSNVDLPQPVGPTMATNSPSATASDARSTAGYEPPSASRKLTVTCASATAGPRAAGRRLLLLHHARGKRGVAELEERLDAAAFQFDQIEEIGLDSFSGYGGAHLGAPLHRRLRTV